MYVEADAFASDTHGNTLLAGKPNLLIWLNQEGRVVRLAEDSVLGAVIPRTGVARSVPSPVGNGSAIDGIRVSPHRRGGWELVFAEVRTRSGAAVPDSAVRLWYGVYDGRHWDTLEELPLPREGRVDPHLASSLVRRGDTLSWAMTTQSGGRRSIVVFERRGGRWSHEIIPTAHAEVELARSETRGLLMLVVQADTTLRTDRNSLFVWARDSRWRRLQRLVHGSGEGGVSHPRASTWATGIVVSWQSQGSVGIDLRAKIGRLEDANPPSVILDSLVTGLASNAGPVTLRNGVHIWVADHVTDENGQPLLRFVSDYPSLPRSLVEIRSPYLGFSAVAATGPDEILVTGLHQVPGRYIVSLLLRTRIECRSKPTPAR